MLSFPRKPSPLLRFRQWMKRLVSGDAELHDSVLSQSNLVARPDSREPTRFTVQVLHNSGGRTCH
jgi:hypothetical protein